MIAVCKITVVAASGLVRLPVQALALSWVERNIGQFGGDPARITLAGQEVTPEY